ncbi:hypothetical protein [Bacillus sp. 37MA]|uniref:hypothetical protein n=1 Tax=Bacillus sp. 37MA TaxID=1132442 RepID=UPI0003762762|nr:hypothetical protein [Bacillus sp. 37MA]
MPSFKNIKKAFQIVEYKGSAIDAYISNKELVKRRLSDKEFVVGFKKVRTDGSLTKKFATLMMIKGCPNLILHIGKKRGGLGLEKQNEVDEKLGQSYDRSEMQINEKPNEVFIRLDWVNDLEDIKEFIDEAYEKRE